MKLLLCGLCQDIRALLPKTAMSCRCGNVLAWMDDPHGHNVKVHAGDRRYCRVIALHNAYPLFSLQHPHASDAEWRELLAQLVGSDASRPLLYHESRRASPLVLIVPGEAKGCEWAENPGDIPALFTETTAFTDLSDRAILETIFRRSGFLMTQTNNIANQTADLTTVVAQLTQDVSDLQGREASYISQLQAADAAKDATITQLNATIAQLEANNVAPDIQPQLDALKALSQKIEGIDVTPPAPPAPAPQPGNSGSDTGTATAPGVVAGSGTLSTGTDGSVSTSGGTVAASGTGATSAAGQTATGQSNVGGNNAGA